MANAALEPLGIDVRHYALLATIAGGETPSQRTVADALQVDRATVVALADDLEARGLARRTPSTADRRAKVLAPTARGRRALEQAHRLMDACEAEFVGALPEGERAELAESLARLLSPGSPPA
jgi:DNA-binding MarR family transcriptional regulator